MQNSLDLLHYFERRTDHHTAADLLAETMLTTWKRIRDLPEGHDEQRMWLFGIARNVLKNADRAHRRRHRLTNKLKVMLRPDDTSQAADSGTEVREAVRRLDPELSELIRLVHWEGFRITEASQIMGVSPSTARGQYQRAKKQLRTILNDENSIASRHCVPTLPAVDKRFLPDWQPC